MNKIIWKTYSEQELRKAVAESQSLAQVCGKLNCKNHGGYYSVIKRRIKILQINTDHFTGQHWSKGRTFDRSKPIESYLKKNSHVTISSLRRRLIREKIFEHKCQKCSQTTWLNEPIPLELHHKDCDTSNNTLENLQLLCPNCHTLTHRVYRRDKKKLRVAAKRVNRTKNPTPPRPNKHGVPFESLKDELADLLWKMPSTKIAEYFKVSDRTICDWCKKFGLEKPPRGYWVKLKHTR